MLSQERWRGAGFFADEFEAADDGGFGAVALAGDLGGAESLDAVETKDFRDGRRGQAAAGVEFFKEGKGEEGGLCVS